MRLTRSAKAVEEEQWAQVDVPPNVQHTVNLLISSATEDSPECLIPPRMGSTTNGNGESVPTKQLHIEDRGFFVVKATSETLVLLADYLKIVINLELVVMDVMSRIIEFLKVSFEACLVAKLSQLVFQFSYLSGCPGCRCHAIGWSQKHHRETSW